MSVDAGLRERALELRQQMGWGAPLIARELGISPHLYWLKKLVTDCRLPGRHEPMLTEPLVVAARVRAGSREQTEHLVADIPTAGGRFSAASERVHAAYTTPVPVDNPARNEHVRPESSVREAQVPRVHPRGEGGPPVITGVTTAYAGEDSVWLVFGDVHFPFADKDAIDKLLWFARMLQPDGIIANGDLLDLYEVSSFSKDPRRKTDTALNVELRQCRNFLRSLTNGTRARWRIYHDGNHEERLARRLANQTPELSNLETPDGELILTVPHLLDLPSMGWEHKEYRSWTTLGDLDVEHGENVSAPAAMPAGATIRNVLTRRQRSTLMGHIHRQAHVINTSRGGNFLHGLEVGCLCELVPGYDPNARWSHGWAVVTVRDGRAFPELVTLLGGRLFWRGEVI